MEVLEVGLIGQSDSTVRAIPPPPIALHQAVGQAFIGALNQSFVVIVLLVGCFLSFNTYEIQTVIRKTFFVRQMAKGRSVMHGVEENSLQRYEDWTGRRDCLSKQYDVAIVGGGLAGLTLALQLKKSRPATSILVVEKQKHPVPEAAHKVGESTVEIGAHYLRDILGLQEHLETRQLIKFGLRFFFSTADNRDITKRVELGHSGPLPRKLDSYQLDRGRLENTLSDELSRQGVA